MDKQALRQRLMGTFLAELQDHVAAINRDLLALEKDAGAARTELLTSLFRSAHSLKGAARAVDVAPIEAACHRLEALLGPARDGHRPLQSDDIELIYATADALKAAGEQLGAQQDATGGRLELLLPSLDAAAARARGAAEGPPASPLAALPPAAATPAPTLPAARDGLVRVPVDKLDALLTGSGELHIARRRVASAGDDVESLRDEVRHWRVEWMQADKAIRRTLTAQPRLLSRRARLAVEGAAERVKQLERRVDTLSARLAEESRALHRAAAALEDDIRRVRMFPFSSACEGLDRTVRDLAHADGKLVSLQVEGGEIEVDRLVLEALKDPLLHLVRNAVDHGIGTPEQRQGAGKPAAGHVSVVASVRGGAVEVVVTDDGRGLDMDAIRAQARRTHTRISDDEAEAAQVVFAPGFSTARVVTEISGRGIGLDIVKHQVESLHGHVIIAFEPGRGTRVVLTVPLTVTTLRALLLEAAGRLFAIPVTHVQRLVRANAAALASVGGREVLLSNGRPVPVVLLTDVLGIPDAAPAPSQSGRAPLVVVSAGGAQVALAVDRLLVEDEILIKNLGRRLRRVRHLAGATILPSGRVALILNTAEVVNHALARAPARTLASALAPPARTVRRRVVLADDSVTTRSLEKSILEAAGYEVLAAPDGGEAWRLLQKHGADLVVADVEMPRVDGFALCERIRRSPRFRELPIVLVTGLESDRDKARGLEVGADAYLPKSTFDQRKLLETIAQLL